MWGNLSMINQNYLFHLLLQIKSVIKKKKKKKKKNAILPFNKLFHAKNKGKC